eukprot:TRINITY_DN2314_c0_g1_i1.p1 TRINITY_DN2314_c0_g1~~TRINITY_DN2314_c0_g1_i1.p1  ORF type:complete len:184 (+),score=43.60 TRINITY_DN2314_c0_g1_i1:29-553(+)
MAHVVWCGYFTAGGADKDADGSAENAAFCEDLWRAVVKAETKNKAGTDSKKAQLLAQRVNKKEVSVMGALIQYCDMSLLYEVHGGRVYRYAIVGFVKRSLMEAIVRADWAALRGDPAFTACKVKQSLPVPPIYDTATPVIKPTAAPTDPDATTEPLDLSSTVMRTRPVCGPSGH